MGSNTLRWRVYADEDRHLVAAIPHTLTLQSNSIRSSTVDIRQLQQPLYCPSARRKLEEHKIHGTDTNYTREAESEPTDTTVTARLNANAVGNSNLNLLLLARHPLHLAVALAMDVARKKQEACHYPYLPTLLPAAAAV